MNPCDLVLLATADWDFPYWTNKQHVAVELARRGFRVLYIDSLGLRRPSASASDAGRMARRLRRAAGGPRPVRENLWVWSPVVLPLHGAAVARRFNRAWLTGGLRRQLRRLGMRPEMLWTYNPLTTELLALDDFKTIVYHCVDEIKAQPGMPTATLDAAERELAGRAHIVFTTTPKLTETRRAWNANTHYFPNVADFDHFAMAREPGPQVPVDLAGIRAPRIGFIGAITGYKLDFELLRYVAQSRPDWSLVLIGEIGAGDPWTDAATLKGLPNLHLLGPRPYAELPGYLKGFDVAILPNQRNEYTAAMFPMKFFEYLAAGVPVVSTELPALGEYRDVARLAATREEFVAGIEEALAGKVAPLERRLAVAREHTYRARTEKMLALVALLG